VNTVKERKHKTGGLHCAFRKPGDTIVITHAGETLEIVWQGKNGREKYDISLVGPKSFQIDRKN